MMPTILTCSHRLLKRSKFNVTRCRYAQFYKELGEPELGFLFMCSQDFPLTEGFSPDLELVRTQTIMQGASYCDFRWRMKEQRGAIVGEGVA